CTDRATKRSSFQLAPSKYSRSVRFKPLQGCWFRYTGARRVCYPICEYLLPLNSDPDFPIPGLGESMKNTAPGLLLVMLLSLTAFAQNAQINAKKDAL